MQPRGVSCFLLPDNTRQYAAKEAVTIILDDISKRDPRLQVSDNDVTASAEIAPYHTHATPE
jgi:hypothetical protein